MKFVTHQIVTNGAVLFALTQRQYSTRSRPPSVYTQVEPLRVVPRVVAIGVGNLPT
ncbi:MAG: hypothetical protein RM338_12185 [Nostoc sp. DedQUE12a]|nr:hypothetical protein [Nostoc sp. DedQUE12a]